ncbi:diversity-generating retroelement protein Avd [Leptolyngbya sp. PCC 6406]|uniref:diversity-generating retroelement protein Avd n=1 Tax=Leptolyngbya sp. PCC 6406 TaxID=1173264 RepID=UPI0002AC1C79|nr:diversity-generating retroelement protein Avd [Leptolyngbya sp. PCC 6406]
MSDLPIIQKTHDLIQWYVPILNRLPRDHKFALGDRIVTGLYDLLEGLIKARYAKEKLPQLRQLNVQLEILRHQTLLLLNFNLLSAKRYEYVGQHINGIGMELGGWIKQQGAKDQKPEDSLFS